MHGNASGRIEILQHLSYLLSFNDPNLSVVSFDFCGSGWSDGDYVSLGYYERDDLQTVVAYLRATLGSSVKIALWGRSMGAASALMYFKQSQSQSQSQEKPQGTDNQKQKQQQQQQQHTVQQYNNISCLILDSSFCDLVQLATEMVDKAKEQGIVVPNVVVSVALQAIKYSVYQKAKFDIYDISPYKHAAHITQPALIVCGEQDDFIKPHHSEQICEHYQNGTTNLVLVPNQDHNDIRPPIVYSAVTEFLHKNLDVELLSTIPSNISLQTSPWQYRHSPQIFKTIHHHHHKTTKKKAEDTEIDNDDGNSKKIMSRQNSSSSTTSSASSTTASSSSVVDTTEIGMTKERQNEIQSSLNTMFGGRGDLSGSSADGQEAKQQKRTTSEAEQGEEIVLQETDEKADDVVEEE